VARLGRSLRPGVIHAHNVEGAAVALAASGDVPVVYHAHGVLSAELPSYLPTHLSASLRAPAARAGSLADRFLSRRAAATIALTEEARDAFLRHGAGAARVHAIPPGIGVEKVDPVDAWRARAGVCAEDETLVLYAGNADAYQELGTLLDAMRLLDAGARRRARLVFAIPGHARDLPAWSAARGLADRVTFLDASWEETSRLLAACDATVIPRSDPHGYPMKLLNALALGAPVIAHPACARDLEDGEHVILARDARETARALERVMTEPHWARRIGAAGRDAVRGRHDWSIIAPRVEAVLAEAAGHHGSGGGPDGG